jgi:hypothetical protein
LKVMSTPAAMHACRASWPEWANVPSPTFWKTCPTSVNGAWPIHWLPSPPIWVRPRTCDSGRWDSVTRAWQPMPPPPIEPSGSTVDRLCGQPLQKYGVRATGVSDSSVRAGAGRGRTATRPASTARRGESSRSAVTCPSTGTSGCPVGPVLPWIAGASGTPYSTSFIWASRNETFSSTTSTCSSPAANSRTRAAPSG